MKTVNLCCEPGCTALVSKLDRCHRCGNAFRDGHRSGLLRAARRASAMAGKLDHKAGKTDIIDGRCHVWLEAGCPKCALLTLAAKLREEAGEG